MAFETVHGYCWPQSVEPGGSIDVVTNADGVVITSGSAVWAHGLAGRDPQVEQITRNVLDRLTS